MKWNWRVFEHKNEKEEVTAYSLARAIYDDDEDLFARGRPFFTAPNMEQLLGQVRAVEVEINKHSDPAPLRIPFDAVDAIDDESDIKLNDYCPFVELGQFKLPQDVMHKFIEKMRAQGMVRESEKPGDEPKPELIEEDQSSESED